MVKLRLAVKKIELITVWLFLAAVIILTALSMYAAFLGAERTRALFCSRPLQIFWIALIVLLIIRLFFFKPLHKESGPLCMYLGVALVLMGNMWGTDSSFRWWSRHSGRQSPPSGYMALLPGDVKTALTSDDMQTVLGELPFGLRLESFRIEYYQADDTGWRPVRSYVSEVTILEKGAETAHKAIRVNHPLYYKGYHIYQYSYDIQNHQYTVLYAKSAQGLRMVYAGFILLSFGVIWWGWAQPLLRGLNRRR